MPEPQELATPAGARPTGPIVLAEQRTARRLERTLRVPPDLAAFEGHFPGTPLVAAVAQIGWVMEAAGALAGHRTRASALEGLRFRDVLRPEQELQLSLELAEAGDVVRFRLGAGERVFAAGRIRLVPAP